MGSLGGTDDACRIDENVELSEISMLELFRRYDELNKIMVAGCPSDSSGEPGLHKVSGTADTPVSGEMEEYMLIGAELIGRARGFFYRCLQHTQMVTPNIVNVELFEDVPGEGAFVGITVRIVAAANFDSGELFRVISSYNGRFLCAVLGDSLYFFGVSLDAFERIIDEIEFDRMATEIPKRFELGFGFFPEKKTT